MTAAREFLANPEAGLLNEVETFAAECVAPLADEVERTRLIPESVWDELRRLGLLKLVIPQELGGHGASMALSVKVTEVLSKACLAVGNIVAVAGTTVQPLLQRGTDDQRRRLLLPVLERGGVACASLTEPDAGSDLQGMRSRATRVDGGYRLNGQKMFALHGGIAELFTIWARTDAGITAFVVPRAAEGFRISEEHDRDSLRGVTVVDLSMDDVFVPEANRLGDDGDGLKFGMLMVNKGRLDVGAQTVGLAEAAFEYAFRYAQTREQFGRPVIDFQAVQLRLADMSTRLETARLITERAAVAVDRGDPGSIRYCAEAKVVCSDMALHVTSNAMQILGGHAYLNEHPLARMMRDAKVYQLLDGTNDMNLLRIAAELRREPRFA